MSKYVQAEMCTIRCKCVLRDATHHFRVRDRLRPLACPLTSQAPKESLVGKTKCKTKTQRGQIKHWVCNSFAKNMFELNLTIE
jgi:hypothetical protein